MTRRRRGREARGRAGRLLFWGAVALAMAAAIVWRAVVLRRAMGEAVGATHALTVGTLLLQATAWGRGRAAHAETVAALLAGDLAGTAQGRAAVATRFEAAMRVLADREGFVAGRVLDAAGAVVATIGTPPGRPAGVLDGGLAPVREPERAPERVRADPAGPDRAPRGEPAVRVVAVRCGGAFCAEFRTPLYAGGRRMGEVVLVSAVEDSTFQPLNASRPGIRTLRTSVLAPLAAGDTLAVVASLGAPGSPEPPPLLVASALPAHVRAARSAVPGRLAIGAGAGLHGAPTHYAVVRVPALDWLLLREFDRVEVLEAERQRLYVEAPIFVALVVSLTALARHRLRARRTRREQELTRLRADFVASTSHELRTPLAQIRLFAELLQTDALRSPEEAARALRIIEKEAGRLTILVDNLLNYTRLRRRAEDAAVASVLPTDVAGEVAHVIEAFAPLAAERGARVVRAVHEGLYARVDSLALRQVLTNFLENAVKYGPVGQTVTVGADADTRSVRLWVDDEGAGVPPEERATVWDAFRRGRRAEGSAQGGSGIGLAVVRELALQYGGGVRIEDAPGGGARFVVEIPRAHVPSS